MADWAQDESTIDKLYAARPDIPKDLSDRQADICEPLLAIADMASGNWPKRARAALAILCAQSDEDESLGVKLLSDIRAGFGSHDKIATLELLKALVDLETDAPWASWWEADLKNNKQGGPAQKLARLLLALGGSTGSGNTALGAGAGFTTLTGAGNVYIGVQMVGTAGENDHTYIRNINTTTVSGGNADSVTVNLSTGLLGNLSCSRRYKEEIKPMDKASEALYGLKPVTYRYKKEIDPSRSLEYGLVAEDVAQVDPNLAIRDEKGQIESVRFMAVNAMLLNEFLKHCKNEEQEKTIAELKIWNDGPRSNGEGTGSANPEGERPA